MRHETDGKLRSHGELYRFAELRARCSTSAEYGYLGMSKLGFRSVA